MIPARASVQLVTWSPYFKDSKTLQHRIIKRVEGAAIATGCRVEFEECVDNLPRARFLSEMADLSFARVQGETLSRYTLE